MPTEVQNVQKQLGRVTKKKSLFAGRKEVIQAEDPLYVL